MPKLEVTANQIFIGCPWKTIKAKYERAIDKLARRYPVAFVIVGRGDDQDAADLLEVIKGKLFSSSYAVFDATGGNANVAMEFGMAETGGVLRALYLSSHESSAKVGKERVIISDLAGKRQTQYKTQEGLESSLAILCKNHPYTKRFESFLQMHGRNLKAGEKKSARTLALKIIHSMDEKEFVRRADVVQGLQGEGYGEDDIQRLVKRMHSASLLLSGQGPAATLRVR